ncbi:MAG: decaprenyl-phosphate phosphoribosyltransferase [Acidimicrobiales bacterium]
MARAVVLLEAIRPRQWVKNLLVAAAPAAATELGDPEVAGRTVVAFAVFTMAAGATYLGNDAADASIDRLHPTRRNRPVASGRLDPRTAQVAAAVLATVALAIAWATAPALAAVIAVYLGVNIAYSLGMKRVPVLELAAVASGFALRAIGGGAATDVALSTAFVVVVSAVSVLIVSAKRGAELARTNGIDGRLVLRYYTTRGLGRVRVIASMVAVIAYAAWVFTADVIDGTAATVSATVSLLAFAGSIASYERAVDAGLGEDPEEILRLDRRLQVLALAWVASYGIAIHV